MSFKIDNFQGFPEIIPYVKKINKYIKKDKIGKLASKIEEFKALLEKNEHLQVPITYILSILIEIYPKILNPSFFRKIEPFINSENIKLKLNSIIILGFYILHHPEFLKQKYYHTFAELLSSKEKDIRDNCYFFLDKMIKKDHKPICNKKNTLLNALEIEIKNKNTKNILSIINFLSYCNNYNFKQLYFIREHSIKILQSLDNEKKDGLKSGLFSLLQELFPEIKMELNTNKEQKKENLIDTLQNIFIMKRYDFSQIRKERNIIFKDYLEDFKNSSLKEKEIYFYTHNQKTNQTNFYELERDKVLEFFEQNRKISHKQILEIFSSILRSSDFTLFIETLLKLGHIQGYFSDFYFYPFNFIYSTLLDDLKEKGIISIKDYNYLPPKYINKCIKEIAEKEENKLLIGKKKKFFYDLSKFRQAISEIATREASIDLKRYRKKLTSASFLKLVRQLPNEYLTKFHKGTSWLTNIGKIKFEQELNNSKIIGYFDVKRISDKLQLNKLLLKDIFTTYVDERIGIWNIPKDKFYYSKYIKSKLEIIDQIKESREKIQKIEQLATKLNIEKHKLKNELDEKISSIAKEIKKKDKIKISKYREKTGMDHEAFFDFINSLGLSYLKKGDILLFNPSKIENAKQKIKQFIKKEFTSKDFISLGNYDINSELMKELIEDLQKSEKLKGIFYEVENEIRFYTEQGIKNMMLSETFIFSLYDFFYEKELAPKEISLLKEIFYDLYEGGKLKGQFDEDTLTFTNEEIVFANDYNASFHEFNRRVNNCIDKFNSEFQKIKKILTKKSTISANEIKWIENAIYKINKRDIYWKNELEAFINRLNEELLEKQGVSMKQLRSSPYLKEKKMDDIKIFAEDDGLIDLMKDFNLWVKLFSKLEKKYENILFYQKRLMKKPDDEKAKERLMELRRELSLIE